MRLPWSKRRKNSAPDISARCGRCRCELPVTFEQALRLAADRTVWLFCPLCSRIVAGEPFVRTSEQGVTGAPTFESPRLEPARSGAPLALKTAVS